ncbi:hypothetical protein GCM10027054_35950 [Isoptericola nanjingensis]
MVVLSSRGRCDPGVVALGESGPRGRECVRPRFSPGPHPLDDAPGTAYGAGMDHEPMRRVAEFRAAFDLEVETARPGLAEHRRALLAEESGEAAEALADLATALAEGGDVAADALGIDLPAVFVEVHRSNMSKVDADGCVLRRADGKVLKGSGYSPPDLGALVSPPTGPA